MTTPTIAFTSHEDAPLRRVLTERRIFVGHDKKDFKLWLGALAKAYADCRIEGYVLDLTGGSLWAFLDLSDVPSEVYDDIVLRAVEADDASASEAFLRLVRNCDPTTAVNSLKCSFEAAKWPGLAATCSLFVGSGGELSVTEQSLLDSVKLLKSEPDRRQQFRFLAQQAAAAARSQLRCHYDLVGQAHRENWPRWAVECLPSLFIPISAPPAGGMKALVWHYLLACLPVDYYEIHASLCRGAVDEATLSPRAVEEIRRVAPVFERRRLENAYPSENSTIGVVIAARVETGLDSNKAPIGKELKEMLESLDLKQDLNEVVQPVSVLPEKKWKTRVLKLAKQDKWPPDAIAALRSIETSHVRFP